MFHDHSQPRPLKSGVMLHAARGENSLKEASPHKDATGCGRFLRWACGHRVVTALIFVCTLVACERLSGGAGAWSVVC